MTEIIFFNFLLLILAILAIVIFISLFFFVAPYGQHVHERWGPTINNKLGWIVMEIPTIVLFIIFYIIGDSTLNIVAIVFLTLWLLHYGQRTFIFPYLMRGKEPMSISIVIMGFIFNCFNAYLQSRWINHFFTYISPNWLITPFFIIGICIFLLGFVINLHSDHIIRNLRKPGENEYKVPYGGMFRWVSCPSYLGEITEWIGWAIMIWSFPGLIFAIWTFANLAPRARSNHLWYKKTFPEYPKNRKALIPFVY